MEARDCCGFQKTLSFVQPLRNRVARAVYLDLLQLRFPVREIGTIVSTLEVVVKVSPVNVCEAVIGTQ